MTANGAPTTNGHTKTRANGSVNDTVDLNAEEVPATRILAEFISSAKASTILNPTLRAKLKEYILDYIGVTASAAYSSESTPAIFKAILALGSCPKDGSGKSTVFTKGQNFLPQYAALLNATFAHSFDFDDTYAEGTLHAGVTTISAALTQAELLDTRVNGTEDFLTALAVGYEITCRLGKELGFAAYSQGMHNTSTAGIFGAVAAISVLKHLSPDIIENAFGLAGSKAAGSMQYLDNGSWNKRLHPGFAVHDAFVCVALAEAGVIGASRIIEGKLGFLHAYSPNQDKDLNRLTQNLGSEWTFIKTSLKPFPACRMTHGLIEMGSNISTSSKIDVEKISKIKISLPPANIPVVGSKIPNKIHPKTSVDAQFSAYFQMAHSLIYGSSQDVNEIYSSNHLQDSRIFDLCDKIIIIPDENLKNFASSTQIDYDEGKTENMNVIYPLGELEHPFTREKVEEKFMSLMIPVYGSKIAERVMKEIDDLDHNENGHVKTLLDMLK